MEMIPYHELLKRNRELAPIRDDADHVVVLSNVVTHPFPETLSYVLRSHQIAISVEVGDYDVIVQESARVAAMRPKAVVLVWELANLVPGGVPAMRCMTEGEINELRDQTISAVEITLRHLRDVPLVIMTTFSAMPFSCHSIMSRSVDELARSLNDAVREYAPPNVVVIDTDNVLATVGIHNAIDERFWFRAKAPYTYVFVYHVAQRALPFFRQAYGMTKKLMVFDGDGTLWRGTIGEDGMAGISMASSDPVGAPFADVQHHAKEMASRGVMLGLVSKNNFADVNDVLLQHRDMILRADDFVAMRINWEDKATNIRGIVEELNIGLDSVVFIDDSDFEVEFVRGLLPEVTVVQVPKEAHAYPALFRSVADLFLRAATTDDDRQRTRQYQQQKVRTKAAEQFASIDAYLASLDQSVRIHVDDVSLISRMAQLTQKTNQFNATTRRYTEQELLTFVTATDVRTVAFHAEDRFGSYGVTGLAILRLDDVETATLDTFLMSCRVIGRGIEHVFIREVLSVAREAGRRYVSVEFFPTDKNAPAADFFQKLGADRTQESSGVHRCILDSASMEVPEIPFIRVAYERTGAEERDRIGARS
jgi:FkbH-like protein